MDSNNINRCGFCNNFKTGKDDIHLIPVGSCENTNGQIVDFHHIQCHSFSLKKGLVRTFNCNGCNYELWPEFSCVCSRNHTSEIDAYHKAN